MLLGFSLAFSPEGISRELLGLSRNFPSGDFPGFLRDMPGIVLGFFECSHIFPRNLGQCPKTFQESSQDLSGKLPGIFKDFPED